MKKKKIESSNQNYYNSIIIIAISLAIFCIIEIKPKESFFKYQKKEVIEDETTIKTNELFDKPVYETKYYYKSNNKIKWCKIESNKEEGHNYKYVYIDDVVKERCHLKQEFNIGFLIDILIFIIPFGIILIFTIKKIKDKRRR